MTVTESQPSRAERLETRLVRALDLLESARPLAKGLYQSEVFEITIRLLKEESGVERLFDHAARFDPAGVFHGGDWDDPGSLQPAFVEAALTGHPLSVAIEALSELRLLAIAEGKAQHERIDPPGARSHLEQVLALNLKFLFGSSAPETKNQLQEGVRRLLVFLSQKIGTEAILHAVAVAARINLRQQPIRVDGVRAMLRMAAEHLEAAPPDQPVPEIETLIHAATGPTALSRENADPARYRRSLEGLAPEELDRELTELATSFRSTNLTSPHHGVALRYVADEHPEKIKDALGLDAIGADSLSTFASLVRRIIKTSVGPETCQAVLGLANLLERGLLFFPPVAPGLWRLMLKLPDSAGLHTSLEPAAVQAGVVSVLGQPLGLRQGNNPTCQSARAMSLWAQSDPGYLLRLVARAFKEGLIEMHFEGKPIRSDEVEDGLAPELRQDLDPVSELLVPHLDRIYAEMSRLVAGRGQDGHKWINPEFHGLWVNRGFAIAVDVNDGSLQDLPGFVALFYATYHPYFNGGRWMIYPQPAGIAATNIRGDFLGWHAVSIQRVALDRNQDMRVYFFDPKEDGGQNWGQDIETSTSGTGELPGESSLKFEEFAARVYLFHYSEQDRGEPEAVPAEEVEQVIRMIRASWGRKFG